MQSYICPPIWVLLRYDTFVYVFGSWRGGYLSSDEWRRSTDIVAVEVEDFNAYITTHSGSQYDLKLSDKVYGATAYSSSIIESMEKQAADLGKDFAVMSFDEAVEFLNSKVRTDYE